MKATTAKQIENASQPGKYWASATDEDKGLFLLVTPVGSKLWRLKYHLDGEKLFAIGPYDKNTLGLAEARRQAAEARTLIRQGIHPKAQKVEAKAARLAAAAAEQAEREAQKAEAKAAASAVEFTLRRILTDWLASARIAESTRDVYRSGLDQLNGKLGDKAAVEITVEELETTLESIAPSVAKIVLANTRRAYKRALRRKEIASNPLQSAEVVLPERSDTVHRAALTKPKPLGDFLRKVDSYPERFGLSVKSAIRLLPLLPVRPIELCSAKWADMDLDDGLWRYFVSKTKREHIVPLPTQVIAVLRELEAQGAGSEWVFPSPIKRGAHVHRTMLLRGIRRYLGYEQGEISAHGFRSSFRTLAEEELEADPVVLELCLAHKMPGPMGGTYARGSLLRQRREVSQQWADYCDKLKADAITRAAQKDA